MHKVSTGLQDSATGVELSRTLLWLIADMPIAILGLEGEGRSFTSALERDI